ncbi:MAG: insulinase family protein, partial [Nitrospirae bacterium]
MLKRSNKDHIKETLLSQNIPLVMEQMQGVHSVSLGIWVKTGSRYEPEDLSGISHFLEHCLFKGTTKRSYRDIAIEIDTLGGELNAFTSKEITSYYVRVPDAYLSEGIDILMDVFLNPVFPEEEIEKEKLVVLEEIKMAEDTPDDLVHDLFSETIYKGNGLGRRILGSPDTVMSFTRQSLIDYKTHYYGMPNVVVSCAGDFDEALLKDKLQEYLNGLNSANTTNTVTPQFNYEVSVIEKDLKEVHIVCGTEGIPQTSEDRYAAMLLNTIIGAGVSSRLFQKIREEKALAYTVYSFLSSYKDTGVFGIYLGPSK